MTAFFLRFTRPGASGAFYGNLDAIGLFCQERPDAPVTLYDRAGELLSTTTDRIDTILAHAPEAASGFLRLGPTAAVRADALAMVEDGSTPGTVLVTFRSRTQRIVAGVLRGHELP